MMQTLAYSVWAQQRRPARRGGREGRHRAGQAERRDPKDSEEDGDTQKEELISKPEQKTNGGLPELHLAFPIFP